MTNFKIPFLAFLFLFSIKNFSQNNCSDAIIVCGNSGFEGLTASGIGRQEISGANSCQGEENNSIWLKLSVKTAGTLGFTLIPESRDIDEDFDFFIFGPNVSCGAIGQAIRCSTTNPRNINQPNNYTGMNNISNDTSEGPGPDGNSFVKWLTVGAGDSYFLVIDRPSGFSNFKLVWNGSATFNTPPTFDVPTGIALDIKQCDSDGVQDFISDFNLQKNDALIIGTQNDVFVTYHTTLNDAIIGKKQIKNPTSFRNTTNPQPIFTRIENSTTGCFNTTEFSVEINNSVNFPKNQAATCDDISDGNDTNGLATFDLNSVTTAIFDNQDTSSLTIKYYLNQSDADLNANELLPFFSNTTPNRQPIVIKAFDGTCSGTKEINLIVKPVPEKIIISTVQCDFGLNPDGLSLFNLNDSIDELTNNVANLSVGYFKNKTEEQNNNPLLNTYTNNSNPETIIGRVTDSTTGCSSLSELTLNVNVIPSQNILPLQQCDILNQENGLTLFNLNDATVVLTPTQTKTFFPTLSDALLVQNSIVNNTNFANPLPYNSSVFIRIEEANNCSSISDVQLIINRLPNIETISDEKFVVCSNLPNRFTTINAGKLETSSTNFNYSWFLNGINSNKSTYAVKINTPGIYTVDVTDSFGCYKKRTINVSTSEIAIIKNIKVTDLTESNTIEVLLNENLKGDFVYSLDSTTDFQPTNLFTGVPSGIHELYVKDLNGCGIVGSITISVLGAPKFFTPNNDGTNDTWNLKGVNKNFNKKAVVQIFNRYGKLLYQMNAQDKGWDGTHNNNPSPSDDYWYVITLENNKTVKGHFSLKR